MCRWVAYIGEKASPYQFLYEEEHSLIKQSLDARKCKSPVNGDGFGIGWYGDKREPGLYRDIQPAWSDENLRSLCYQMSSSLFMAHVRASTGTATMRGNCHPFRHENCLFMHNGQIGEYMKIRRELESLLDDKLYNSRFGSTDSEIIFLYLLQLGAMEDFHGALEQMITNVTAIMSKAGIREAFRCTACFSNGEKIWAARFSTDSIVPSLYLEKRPCGFLLVSEPLNDMSTEWCIIEENHSMVLDWRRGASSMRRIESIKACVA